MSAQFFDTAFNDVSARLKLMTLPNLTFLGLTWLQRMKTIVFNNWRSFVSMSIKKALRDMS